MSLSGGIAGLIADGWRGSNSSISSKSSVAWIPRQASSAGGFIRHRFAAWIKTLQVGMRGVATVQEE